MLGCQVKVAVSTCETRPQVQNDRSQHILENECFREFPKNDADQGSHQKHTHTQMDLHAYTGSWHGERHVICVWTSYGVHGQSVHKYRNTQVHKVMYPGSDTHTLPSPASQGQG